MTLREILYVCEHDDMVVHVRHYEDESEILSFWLSDWLSDWNGHTRDYDDCHVIGWSLEDGILTLYIMLGSDEND